MKKQFLWLLLAILLVGCQLVPTPMPEPTMPPKPTQSAEATNLSPAENERSLVVCLGSEPQSLYLYGGSSEVMWSIFEAIYDGPIDTRSYTPQPVILDGLPSLENGTVIVEPVDVRLGDIVVNVNGDLVALANGVTVLPTGCGKPECARIWDEVNPFQMDRMRTIFTLLPGIKWADGAPLTADDSIYSYELSNDPATPVSRQILDRTASYQVLDTLTLQWTGLPGFYPLRYETLFWHPLPRHAWGQFSAAELMTSDVSTHNPLGWGPYMIEEWVAGDHITMRKNQNYFRIDEGLPKFDKLVYRFLNRPADSNLAALVSGECDILDRTTGLEEQAQNVRQQEINNQLKMYQVQGPEWEQVVFGIRPSVYDNPDPTIVKRPDYFSDIRMRQAFVYCMNRDRVIEYLLYQRSSIPSSYLTPDHPQYLSDLAILPYDVNAGSRLLDEVGWKDTDNNPQTPRQAVGIPGVADSTSLTVNYVTTKAQLRQEVANLFADSMLPCGIQLNIQYDDPVNIYAPGENGLLFGRNFDMVQIAWQAGLQPPCTLYTSDQIPTKDNLWLGVNISGYSNPAYDSACRTALQTYSDLPEYTAQHAEAQRIFVQDIPAVPLYFRIRVTASRPDLCGFEMNTTTRSDLWNLENFDYGESCPQ